MAAKTVKRYTVLANKYTGVTALWERDTEWLVPGWVTIHKDTFNLTATEARIAALAYTQGWNDSRVK